MDTRRAVACACLAASFGAATLAGAQPAYRVKDINPGGGFGSGPSDFLRVGDTTYFIASDDANGGELWATDGTAEGTRLVRDISPGPDTSAVHTLTDFGGTLFFVAVNGLWRTDGTAAGTVRVRPDLTNADGLVIHQGALYFAAYEPTNGYELWKTDGTDAGTTLVKDIVPGADGSVPSNLVSAGGLLYFAAIGPVGGLELWRSDGSAAGTLEVWDVWPGPAWSLPESLVAVGNLIYFTAEDGVHGRELWRYDTLGSTAMLVEDIEPGPDSSLPHDFRAFGGLLYFGASDFLAGDELWRSDGTPLGTYRVRDIRPGVADSSPEDLTLSSGVLFFSANDGLHGPEVWRSDGTEAGTVLVREVSVVGTGGQPFELTDVGGVLYFVAEDGVHGRELWRSDGTFAGTSVLDLRPGIASSFPGALAEVDGRVYFSAATPESPVNRERMEPWTSDGTLAGSAVFARIGSTDASRIQQWVDLNGTLLFSAEDDEHGTELWRSDGTEAGTTLVRDIRPGPAGSSPRGFAVMNGVAYFNAWNGNRFALWRSDGTPAGTTIVTGPTHSIDYVQELRVLGSNLVFAGADSDHGNELWMSDGTEAGTVLVRDINPGLDPSDPHELTVLGGTLFFVASDPAEGAELWRSDGTAAGTVRVQLVQPGPATGHIRDLTAIGGLLYYSADDAFHGREPWRSDGAAAGTFMIRDVRPGVPGSFPDEFTDVSGVGFFAADDGSSGRELWRTQGSEATTQRVADIRPGPAGSDPGELTRVGSRLFFAADNGVAGRELWRSDGTLAGTTLVRDVYPGPTSSLAGIHAFGEWGGWAFFGADSPGLGRELWRSDGTAAGTTLVQEIAPGASSGLLTLLSPAGGHLFLRAVDDAGDELWVVRPELRVSDTTAKEGTPASLQVSMIPALDVPLAVPFATADGSATATFDYAPAAGLFTFAPGATTHAVDVAVLEDLIDEPNEDFFLDLTGPASAHLADPRGRVIVTDDDPTIVMSVNDVEVTEGHTGEVSAAFTVRLTPAPVTTATVRYDTHGGTATGSDFSALAGTLTFTPSVETQLVHVPVFGDSLDEPDEFFFLRLSNPTAAVIGDGEGIARIRDDDGGTVRIQALQRDDQRVTDLAAQSERVADEDLYIFGIEPHSSYEITVDGASGDLGNAGPSLEMVTPDFASVLPSVPVGTGPARALRLDAGNSIPLYRYIRVRSFGCTTDCGPDDTYRIRVRDTTGHVARFNDVGDQRTVLILQNRLDQGIRATVTYWRTDGTVIVGFVVQLAPHASSVMGTTSATLGLSGSITVSHDGPLGALAGKAVALDPTTGLAFDTPLTTRPR